MWMAASAARQFLTHEIEPSAGRKDRLLHHHGDLLSQRPAAYRPCLRGDRHRRHRALRAARRQGRVLPDRHRRARPQDEADGREAKASRPQTLADRNSQRFRDMAAALDLSQRRLHPHHRAAPLPLVARRSGGAWRRHGDIYLGKYAGWYSVRDEAFYDEKRDDARRRTACAREPLGSPVEWIEEETYFFRLSAYQDRLLAHYDDAPRFHPAAERRNEVMSFVKGGLEDLSVSRTTLRLGHQSGRARRSAPSTSCTCGSTR